MGSTEDLFSLDDFVEQFDAVEDAVWGEWWDDPEEEYELAPELEPELESELEQEQQVYALEPEEDDPRFDNFLDDLAFSLNDQLEADADNVADLLCDLNLEPDLSDWYCD